MDYSERPVDYDPFAPEAATDTAALPPIDTSSMVLPPPTPSEQALPASPAPPPTPATAAPVGGFKETPVDFDPFAPAYNPAEDYAITRGAKVAYEAGQKATGTVADLERWSRMDPKLAKAEMLKPIVEDPSQPKMQVPSLTDIGSVPDAFTFAGESIGQMFGSVGSAMVEGGAPGALVGGGVGAAVGATALGAGALPGAGAGAVAGATYGTAGHFIAQGIAGTYQDLMSDPGVRKRLENDELTPNDIFLTATGLGTVIGAIDIMPEANLLSKFGGKVSKDALKTSLIKAVVKGGAKQAGIEGGTEGLQGAISEIGQAAIGKDTNLPQRVMSVIDQTAAGAFGGFGPGAIAEAHQNARIPETAAPAKPPGVSTAAPSPGQSTPGGAGAAAASPPAQGVAQATVPAAVVIPQGQIDPSLAAATAPEISAAASSTAPEPAAGVVIPQIPAAQSEQDVLEQPLAPTEEDDIVPPPAVAKTAAERIKAVLQARAKQAETVTVGPINADLTAAIAAAEPAAPAAAPIAPPPVPQVAAPTPAPVPTRPEPIGTAAAAERRAQPMPPPVEAALPEPVSLRNASTALAGPIVETPVDYDPFAGKPVEAVSAAPGVPAQPAAPSLLAPQPAAAAPKITPIGRSLAGRVRQELINDQVTENPDYNNTVDQVAAELTSALPRGTAPARAVEQHVAGAVATVRERLSQAEASGAAAAAAAETQRAEQQMARAAEIARKRETKGKPQERKRTGAAKGKGAQAIADEGLPSTLRAYQAELKKPEAQRDPDLVAWGEAYQARSDLPKKGATVSRAEHTEAMQAAQARRIARQTALEAETRRPEVVPSTTDDTRDAETRASDEMHARNKVVGPAIGEAFTATPEPNWDRIPTTPEFKTTARAYIQEVMAKTIAALKAAGHTLHAVPNRNYSLEENLMIFGRKILAEKDPNGLTPVDFITAIALARDGQFADFYNAITGDTMGGSQLEGNEVLKGMQPGAGETEQIGHEDYQYPAMDRGAATEAALLDLSRAQREAIARTGIPDNSGLTTFDFPVRGGPAIEMTATRTADALTVLREVTANAFATGANRSGLYGVVRRAVLRRLRQTMGDVQIRFVSSADFAKIAGHEQSSGLYVNLNPDELATGAEPFILINSEHFDAADPGRREDTIVHEMVHAATSFALSTNLHGTKRIVERLRDRLEKHLKQTGAWDSLTPDMKYGFTDAHEFLAEANSNAEFQQILADNEVPAAVRDEINPAEVRNTWWDVLINTVANALGLRGLHARTHTYLDQVMRLMPSVELTSEEQQARGVELRGVPTGPFDIQALRRDVQDALNAMKSRHGFRWYNRTSRFLSTRMVTTEQLKRQWIDQGGKTDDPFIKMVDLFLGQTKRRARRREAGDLLTARLNKYSFANHQAGQDLADYLFDATRSEVDGSVPLTHPNNKHIHKTGPTHGHLRAAHARAVTAWNKLDAQGQGLAKELTDHYSAQENERLRLIVKNAIEQIMRPKESGGFGVTLPTGKSVDDAVEWVLSGAIDRVASEDPANPKLGERTPDDIAWHKALGKTAETLTGTGKMRRIRGTYVPLMRWGKYYFTVTHKVPTPAGAIEDPTGKDGSAFIFLDKNDLNAFTSTTDEQISNVQQRWYDPGTGDRTTKQASYTNAAGVLVNPMPGWRVSIQNRTMEMHDQQDTLALSRDKYASNPAFNTPTEVAIVDKLTHGGSDILPRQINRLIDNIKQSTEGNVTVGQQANVNAVVDAYVKQLAGSRAAHRRLKRANVGGYSQDLVRSTLSANRTMAGHLANLETSGIMSRLDNELTKLIDVGKRTSYPSDPSGAGTLRRQEQVVELRRRIEAIQTRNEENWGERLMNSVVDASFVTHLATPSYTVTNMMQPAATTYPVLADTFGDGAAIGTMWTAYWDLGGARTLLRGGRQTGREILLTGQRIGDLAKRVYTGRAQPIRDLNTDTFVSHHIDAMNRMAGKPDSALFNRFMDKLEELGFDASAGLDVADISNIEKNALERGAERGTKIARAMAEAVEAVNRYSTGLAALRLAKHKGGMTDEAAIDYAITTVEKTQGGYAAENNPVFMSRKWLRFTLQFKKYSVMYGQLYYGALARALSPDSSMAMRKDAGKSLLRLSAMAMLFAGVSGVAPMELARVLVLLSSGMLGTEDFETWENGLQGWFHDAVKWATGNEYIGTRAAEVLMRGAFRMLEVDTSSRLGNDSMALFGQPDTMDTPGILSWMASLAIGAPGGTIVEAFQTVAPGGKPGRVPMPKLFADVQRAGQLDSWPEAMVQAFGFRPASQARKWEYGGSSAANKAEKQLKIERTTLMTRYAEADPSRRSSVWRTEIAAWNRAHRSKKERIEFSDLRRSLQTRKQKARERARAN